MEDAPEALPTIEKIQGTLKTKCNLRWVLQSKNQDTSQESLSLSSEMKLRTGYWHLRRIVNPRKDKIEMKHLTREGKKCGLTAQLSSHRRQEGQKCGLTARPSSHRRSYQAKGNRGDTRCENV